MQAIKDQLPIHHKLISVAILIGIIAFAVRLINWIYIEDSTSVQFI